MRVAHANRFWMGAACAAAMSSSLWAAAAGPAIDVWYGPEQNFAAQGSPIRFVNVLGSITPADQVAIAEYTVNGGAPVKLKLGPDLRRLSKPGDFNIELETGSLRSGKNTVVIEARGRHGAQSSRTALLNYTPGRIAHLPFTIHWSQVSRIDAVAQVLDGLWKLTPQGVRPVEIGYDRLIALGDMYWKDYDVRAPVTIHSFNT